MGSARSGLGDPISLIESLRVGEFHIHPLLKSNRTGVESARALGPVVGWKSRSTGAV